MIRFAILGLGYISARVAKGIQCSKQAQLYALCSRDLQKAKALQLQYGAQKAYGSYEELCQDKDVDVIYICTPNHLHFEQIKMCLQYKKHVICEKPMVCCQKELDTLYQFANQNHCLLMEANKTWFTPLNQTIYKSLQANEYGKIISIQADYSYDCKDQYDKDSWAMHPVYGGCSFDVGVYPVCFCHKMANSQIQSVDVSCFHFENNLVDYSMMAQIHYENGIVAQANSSWLHYTKDKGKALIVTDKAVIEIPAFWKSSKAYIERNGQKSVLEVEMESDFSGEIDAFCDSLLNGKGNDLFYQISTDIYRVIEKGNQYRKSL